MILDRVTLKQGKTHCERGQITGPIGHVVPSGAESIEMHVFLTSKYGSRVLLAMYTGYSFGLHSYLMQKSDHDDKLSSSETTFGF